MNRNFGEGEFRDFPIPRKYSRILFVTIEKTGNGPKGAREGTEIMVQNYYNTSGVSRPGQEPRIPLLLLIGGERY